MGAVMRWLVAVASFILGAVTRAAKRWGPPGAGPKVVSG
jgi:hypothetical protein